MRRHPLWLHAGLFLATFASTYIAQGSWAFAAALMGILLAHEMGHFVLGRIHRVDVSLPYFIPLPLPGGIGTFGAVIRMRSPIRDRNALADVGAAGPLAGLAVAVPVILYGLSLSPVEPIREGGLVEGNSILYLSLKLAAKGAVLPGGGLDVYLHPIAFAGWVGLLVTFINLIPIGQLDGGHVAYAWFGQGHDRASALLHRALPPVGVAVVAYVTWDSLGSRAIGSLGEALPLGLQAALPWFVWTLLLIVLRRFSGGAWHPPVGDAPLTPGRRRLCWTVLVVWLLIFTPIPFRVSLP